MSTSMSHSTKRYKDYYLERLVIRIDLGIPSFKRDGKEIQEHSCAMGGHGLWYVRGIRGLDTTISYELYIRDREPQSLA